MNIFEEKYPLGVVAAAIQTNPDTIKTWMKKDLIATPPTPGNGPGIPRLHTFFGVMEMAVAATLIGAGVKENDVVFRAASFFAHTGDGGTGFRPGRIPGCPFHEGLTYIAVGGDNSTEVCYSPGTDMMAETRAELRGAEVIIFVEINSIFRRVVTALGHDPAEVMQIAKHDLDLMGA